MTANPLLCVVESRPQDHTLLTLNANNSTKYQARLYKVVQQLRRSGRNFHNRYPIPHLSSQYK